MLMTLTQANSSREVFTDKNWSSFYYAKLCGPFVRLILR